MNRAPAQSQNPYGWPWGTNTPSRERRLLLAAGLALITAIIFHVIHFLYEDSHPGVIRMHSDFSLIWHGASFLKHGNNPFESIGPGLEIGSRWGALYPATAYIIGIPFTLVPEEWGSIAFVATSTGLLVFGATQDSWHRIPMFASVPFLTGAILGQWSMLMTAIVFIPWLAVVACAKPQAALPAVITSRKRIVIAVAGGIPILAISLIVLPSWPGIWLNLISQSTHLRPPIANLGGFLVLLVLLRWRRPEAWMTLSLALMPQTWHPHNWLILLTLPRTYREACALSLITSVGGLAGQYAVYGIPAAEQTRLGGAFAVAFAFIPATLLILRRPNENEILVAKSSK